MKGIKIFAGGYIALLMCVFVLPAKAQVKHAIYIQTDDRKLFYVTADGETKNSTESGYIILSQITDSLYSMAIGSPGNEFPEQKFVVNMSNTDWEFTLKKGDSNKYELFDMIHSVVYKAPVVKPVEISVIQNINQDSEQQKAVVKNDTVATVIEQKSIVKDSVLLSNSVQQKSIIKTDTATIVPEQNVVKKDSLISSQQISSNNSASALTQVQQNNQKIKNLKINKIFERITTEGVDQIYVDERKPKFDTIALYIPIIHGNLVQEEHSKKIAEPVKPKPVFITPTPEPEQKVVKKDTVAVVVKQHCTNVASDDDFLSLRKQMASANSEEEMLTTAKGSFFDKCYSVAQIKNLSVLFLNEKNKFSFFQMAKPATTDSKDFYKLINQLTQPDLIEKFAALIQQ